MEVRGGRRGWMVGSVLALGGVRFGTMVEDGWEIRRSGGWVRIEAGRNLWIFHAARVSFARNG